MKDEGKKGETKTDQWRYTPGYMSDIAMNNRQVLQVNR